MPEPLLPRVRVVVLNWNSAWFTRRCLSALMQTDYPSDRLEIVLVDNASVDGSLELLRHEFPDLDVVANTRNLGFAEGCNRAMRHLDGIDLVALVNNDAVVEPGWLHPLVDALEENPRAGAAAARLVLEPAFVVIRLRVAAGQAVLDEVLVDGAVATRLVHFDGVRSVGRTEWPMELVHHLDGDATMLVPVGPGDHVVTVSATGSGSLELRGCRDESEPGAVVELDRASCRVSLDIHSDDPRVELLNGLGTQRNEVCESYDRYFGESSDPSVVAELDEPPRVVMGFSGGGVLLRTDMLRSVGLFDPRFFAYYEDSDLSWRAARAGWETVAVPASIIRHAFGGSGGSRSRGFFFLNYRNWLLTVLRNGTAVERRRAVSSARERIWWAVRANVASPLRHRRAPNGELLVAWLRTVVGVVAVRAAQRPPMRRRLGDPPVGSRPTDRVRSLMQPEFDPGPPMPRPGGPVLVHLDVTQPSRAAQVLAGLAGQDRRLDVVPVVFDGEGVRRASPSEVARLLGLRGEQLLVDPAQLRLPGLAAGSVLVTIDERGFSSAPVGPAGPDRRRGQTWPRSDTFDQAEFTQRVLATARRST